MTTKKTYGRAPIKISELNCQSDEMFFYQYLPIRMVGSVPVMMIPDQLEFLRKLVENCCGNFINEFGYTEYKKHYIYLTAKRLYVSDGNNLNREGWHSDGFGTKDINYVWCDSVPTMYIEQSLTNVPSQCDLALQLFDKIGFERFSEKNHKTVEVNTLYRLDETVIHSTSYYVGEPRIRTFVKVSFSKDKYNLKGNSHNYLFRYKWDMKDREPQRNHPSKK